MAFLAGSSMESELRFGHTARAENSGDQLQDCKLTTAPVFGKPMYWQVFEWV